MSECKLNHSHEDVRHKYESQMSFLPDDMKQLFEQFFESGHTQEMLNEVFHLLKKYDLAPNEEKISRNSRLYLILQN